MTVCVRASSLGKTCISSAANNAEQIVVNYHVCVCVTCGTRQCVTSGEFIRFRSRLCMVLVVLVASVHRKVHTSCVPRGCDV